MIIHDTVSPRGVIYLSGIIYVNRDGGMCRGGEGGGGGGGQEEIVECFMRTIDFSFALWRLRRERLGWSVFDRGGRFYCEVCELVANKGKEGRGTFPSQTSPVKI